MIFSVLVFLIFVVPVIVTAAPIVLFDNPILRIALIGVSPIEFLLVYILTAGILSSFGRAGILPGQFPRDVKDKTYFKRKIYGLCWGAVFYSGPGYWAALAISPLRNFLFFIFGYRGTDNFVIQPDCWIRDLPLLKLSQGSYLANKCTLGTNLCLNNGTILVDSITLGQNVMIGHLAILGPGTRIDDNAEIAVGAAIGVRTQIGRSSKIKGSTSVSHGVLIERDCDIGGHSAIGLRSVIRSGIFLPEGSVVPAGTVLNNQGDADALIREQRNSLRGAVDRMSDSLKVLGSLNRSEIHQGDNLNG